MGALYLFDDAITLGAEGIFYKGHAGLPLRCKSEQIPLPHVCGVIVVKAVAI